MRIFLALSFFLLSFLLFAQSWKIEKDYEIAFSGKKAEGSLRGLSGLIIFHPDSIESAIFDVAVEVNTIETGNTTKNKHAMAKSWFFVDQFPKIHFKSRKLEKTSKGYVVRGELRMRGVKREVQMPFTFSSDEVVGVFEGSLSVNRKDFGIMGNFMEFLVGEEFKVLIKVPVTRG